MPDDPVTAAGFDVVLEEVRHSRRGRDRIWMGIGAFVGAVFLGVMGSVAAVVLGGSWPLVLGAVVGLVAGGGVAFLVVRRQAKGAAHVIVAAEWAAAGGWAYSEKHSMPGIDLAFMRQGDDRWCEDGADGEIAGHPAEFVNFTVEEESHDADGDRHVTRHPYFLLIIHRRWAGPHLSLVRRSVPIGRGIRNAMRSGMTARQVVEVENDAFASEFQLTLPDAWDEDVAFLLVQPDMQEMLVAGARLADVLQVDVTPRFVFLAWKKHFSSEDIPLLERRITDAAWLAERWGRDVPLAMRPVSPPPPD